MLKIKRYQMMQIHMMFAAFLLPIAMMYFISGALYTLDVKGRIQKKIILLQLEQPFTPNLDDLTALVKKTLREKELPSPNAEPYLKKRKGLYELRWGDLKYAIKLQSTKDPMVAKLTFRKRSFLTQVMRIHRAEAGWIFKSFAIVMVVGLLVIFVTGIYMAQALPKFRRPVFMMFGFGLLVMLSLMFI